MKILAFAEQRDNKFKKSAFEVIRTARTIADQTGGDVIALVIGDQVQAIAGELGGYGVSKVLIVEQSKLGKYSSTAYAKIIAEAAKKEQADIIFLSATAMGKDAAARIAVKLDAGLASDCTALKVDGGNIIATRPVYAGKALTEIKINSAVKVFTLRPNVFPAGASTGAAATVEVMDIPLAESDFASLVIETMQASGKIDVAEADIIVTGGRGMKGPENFKMIEDLAHVLGGAVGASRAVVDAGWRPHNEQVGQTGKTVSPSLYIAVAVSGAIQHLAGMSSSKYIVAVNKDKDAPIFQIADYGIVADAFVIVPAIMLEAKKLLGK
ncbi:MAG: electron transfer flavoprotein subunit alpha/FixB family protein [Ignavibacteriales bacterium]|nr:electron transfer flavoprotein subunit alpha/FixB family protein [Ignavibacteriales bacterium]